MIKGTSAATRSYKVTSRDSGDQSSPPGIIVCLLGMVLRGVGRTGAAGL